MIYGKYWSVRGRPVSAWFVLRETHWRDDLRCGAKNANLIIHVSYATGYDIDSQSWPSSFFGPNSSISSLRLSPEGVSGATRRSCPYVSARLAVRLGKRSLYQGADAAALLIDIGGASEG